MPNLGFVSTLVTLCDVLRSAESPSQETQEDLMECRKDVREESAACLEVED